MGKGVPQPPLASSTFRPLWQLTVVQDTTGQVRNTAADFTVGTLLPCRRRLRWQLGRGQVVPSSIASGRCRPDQCEQLRGDAGGAGDTGPAGSGLRPRNSVALTQGLCPPPDLNAAPTAAEIGQEMQKYRRRGGPISPPDCPLLTTAFSAPTTRPSATPSQSTRDAHESLPGPRQSWVARQCWWPRCSASSPSRPPPWRVSPKTAGPPSHRAQRRQIRPSSCRSTSSTRTPLTTRASDRIPGPRMDGERMARPGGRPWRASARARMAGPRHGRTHADQHAPRGGQKPASFS